MKLFKHLRTIHKHRKEVRKMCWKMGLFWQGLTHDLSKYSFTELKMCRYWTGKGSPHQACREAIGYSPSWIHHYHKNKHHFQYWWDEDELGKIIPMKMPYKYVIESFCDMVGASKSYNGKKFKPVLVWRYYDEKCEGKRIMNKESEHLLKRLLYMYQLLGEYEFINHYKEIKKELKIKYESGQLMEENFYDS